MKQVLKVSDLEQAEQEELQPIQLTHYFNGNVKGWEKGSHMVEDSIKIVHLGVCPKEKMDLFAVYYPNVITICKGHLNDGVY